MSQKYGIKQSLKKLAVHYVPPKIEELKKFEHACCPCSREKQDEVEAVHYCTDCGEKLCSSCASQHKKFLILKTHKIVDVTQAPGCEFPAKEKLKLTEKCPTHPSKLLELYCSEDDEVGCVLCVENKHKECSNIVHIIKASKDLSKTLVPKEANSEMALVKRDVTNVKLKRLGDKKNYKKARDDILATIEALRVRIDKVFHQLETEAKQKLKRKYDTDIKGINRDIKACDEAVTALEAATKKIKAENDVQLFINIKKDAKHSIELGRSVSESVTENIGKENVNFVINEDLENWLNELRALGKFDHEEQLYTGSLLKEFDIEMKNDSTKAGYACNGVACLPDGNIVIADWRNCRVKIADAKYCLRGACNLPGEPYYVCSISNNLVAVTLRDEKVVQFVGIDNFDMTLDKKLKLDEYCRGIAHHDNHLYITVGGGEGEIHGQLRVYSMEGEIVKIYEEDIVHTKLFFMSPKDVIVSDDGVHFYVSDNKQGVVILRADGRLTSVFNDPSLKPPLSLCMDINGELLVSGCNSNNVIQITSSGEKIGEILHVNDGINKPLAICCHERIDTRLIVTEENSSRVKVYSLQK